MISIREALRRAREKFVESESADLDAQTLLAYALCVERVHLLAHADEELPDDRFHEFTDLVARRAAGEPIAYITGRKWFYDLELLVGPAVLIPRPETELLLEEGLRLMAGVHACQAADIGAGSGALAVTFARHRPDSRVYATDISAEALCVTRSNAERHGVELAFLQGDLAGPLMERGIALDLLMANLPYIASADLDRLAVSRYEPRLALDGGEDGLLYLRRLLGQIPRVCRSGAWILLEIGADQGQAATELVENIVGARADVLRDYAGLDRILRFRIES